MVTPISTVSRRTIAAALLAAPVVLANGCAPNQPPSTSPGTTPQIWTGSPEPVVPGEAGTASGDSLIARLTTPDGTQAATATFDFSRGYATITVQTVGTGHLTPGFHGLHIHAIGKCEANSVAPAGGEPGNFLSAGGHYQVPGHNEHPQSGDLTSLYVRSDGGGFLVTATDAFSRGDLLAGERTTVIIHADPDNFGNIPAERYSQVNGTPGPDHTTLTTGDAGKRVACGVIESG